jgi:two-component system, sensor histidine kinase and response regulator
MFQSSIIFTRTINQEILLQLCSMWSNATTLGGNDILLVTEETLFSQENGGGVNLNPHIESDKFYLLVNSDFTALLWIKTLESNHRYLANLTFDGQVICNFLEQLSQQSKYNFHAIESLKNNLIDRWLKNNDDVGNFALSAIAILTQGDRYEPVELSDLQNQSLQNPSRSIDGNNRQLSTQNTVMKELLHYQQEQKQIFDLLKTQIAQHLNLANIIQTAIERSCQFLELDRLVIYQLDVATEIDADNLQVENADIVTYEAKKSEAIVSILNFKEEICFRKKTNSIHKYHQGFSSVIQDIENGSNLHPCLQSLMRQLQVRAKIITPINVQGKLWGFAIAHQCFAPRQWQQKEIQFLRQMTEHLALAIQQNQSYQQLQQQKISLEKQVKTQAQQIKDALIAAEAASQSKHEFLGSMSHELRTPLTCVIGLSGTLLQWSFNKNSLALPVEKQQQYLQLIQESGKHLLNIIDSILEFSEVESGKHLLNITQISLEDIAKRALKISQPEARAKTISLSLEYRVNPEADLFFADAERLTEILLNLIGNGIKFTPPQGKVILRIWREQRQVIFQVEDTGIGIATPEIPLLFEKFKQLEDFRRRTQGGTGVGLALTKQLIELHGGTIEVESQIGRGSIFTFYLPETQSEPINSDRESAIHHSFWRSPTVVLVTEDEENAVFICQLLTAIDYQVVWLTDATTAIEKVALLEPTLVIIDRDSWDTSLQKIASDRLSLILLCSQLTAEEWQYFAANGVNDYWLKSMSPTEIVEKLNTSLEKHDL